MNTLLALVLATLPACFQAQAQERKPNVLLLMADDLNTALSGFAHPQCRTPRLDQLAERGVRFANVHCHYPVCGSSRASLMTGLYPYANGMLGNSGDLRKNLPDVVTLSQMFRQNGYHAGRISSGFAHQASASFLTGAPGAGHPGFRNGISLDQFAADHIGQQTRFPSLALSGQGAGGDDRDKLAQLKIVGWETMKTVGSILTKLQQSKEAGGTLLDRTTVILGGNLGDGSSHSPKILPVFLAGGGFKHGQHLHFDPQNAPPLSNLYVTMLQRLGIETDKFAPATGNLTGLPFA